MTSILEFHPDYTDVLECPGCGGSDVDVTGVEVIGGRGQRMRVNAQDEQIVELQMLEGVRAVDVMPYEHVVTLLMLCGHCGGYRIKFGRQHFHTYVQAQPR